MEPPASTSQIKQQEAEVAEPFSSWGRKTEATWFAAAASLAIVLICPVWIVGNWISLEYFDGSLASMVSTAYSDGISSFTYQYAPRPSMKSSLGYASWLAFQAALYSLLPGPISTGQLTPAGNLLKYKTNGLLAWVVTHILTVVAAMSGVLDLALIAKHWEGLIIAVNVYGFLLAGFAQIKAHVAPTHPDDRKFSGQISAIVLIMSKLTRNRVNDFRFFCWY